MHRDTVIGIVGVVILVAAMVGVFTYERGQAADLNDTTGTLTTFTGPATSGSTGVGAQSEETMDLNQTGMTNVTFTLSWTASAGVDTLQLIVVSPDGNATQSEEENDGTIAITVPVANTGPTGTTGVGDWQITVAFVRASTGLPQDPPVPVPNTTDAEVSWEIESTIQAYSADA